MLTSLQVWDGPYRFLIWLAVPFVPGVLVSFVAGIIGDGGKLLVALMSIGSVSFAVLVAQLFQRGEGSFFGETVDFFITHVVFCFGAFIGLLLAIAVTGGPHHRPR